MYIIGIAGGTGSGKTTVVKEIVNSLPEGSVEVIHIEPKEVIIVEGIMALVHPELRELMDLKIFVDADADDRLIRLIRRDVIERGRTAETVISRYERIVKEMHWEFIEPTKKFADIIMPQGGHNKKAIKALQMSIGYFLK